MHKRTQIKQSKKRQSVQEALSIIEPLFAHVLNSTIETQTSVIMSTYEFSHDLSVISGDEVRKTIVDDCNVEINWDSIPSSINPSHGELDEIRSKR